MEWLGILGIVVSILLILIPAVWKNLRFGVDRELREKYLLAAREVARRDKSLRRSLKSVVKDKDFWENYAHPGATKYREEKESFCQKFEKQTDGFFGQRARSIVEHFYTSVYNRLEHAKNESLRDRFKEWTNERNEEPKQVAQPLHAEALFVSVFYPPDSSEGLVDRDDDLKQLRQWLKEDRMSLKVLAELTGRGKTYLAQALYEEVEKSDGWNARWIDFSKRAVQLDSLLMAFANILPRPLTQRLDLGDDLHLKLTDTSLTEVFRLPALIDLLDSGRDQWLIVFDEYDLAPESIDEFVERIGNRAKRTKLLLIGQTVPAVLGRLTAKRGADIPVPLKPLPFEFAREYFEQCQLRGLSTLSERRLGEIWWKCGQGEPGLMKRFAECRRHYKVKDLLKRDISQWSKDTREDLEERIDRVSKNGRVALRASSLFSAPTDRGLVEAVCSAVLPDGASEAINELIDDSLFKFDGERISLDKVILDVYGATLSADEAKPLHTTAAMWLEQERSRFQQEEPVGEADEEAVRFSEQWMDSTRSAFYHWREAGESARALTLADDLWAVTEAPPALCDQALELCDGTNDKSVLAKWLRRKAAMLHNGEQNTASEEIYRQSLELSREAGDQRGQAQTEAELGELLLKLGRYDEAADCANHARLLAEQVGDKVTHAAALHTLGLVEKQYTHFHEALTWLKTARALRQEANLPVELLQEDIDRVREAISMRTILTTVGTSLLSNAKRDLKTEQPDAQQLVTYLRDTTPQRASAETNSLSRLLAEGDDRVVFLCSHTEDGRRCAEALQRHYEAVEVNAPVIEVPDLNYSESRFKMRGLRSLVATMIDQIQLQRAEGREVLISATGGFKAEIAYATLVGLVFDVPVYYIHEAFQDIIMMPPIPIAWDHSLMAEYDDFFEWIDSEPRPTPEVALRELPEKVKLLLTDEEGFTKLALTGEVFYEAYRDLLLRGSQVSMVLSEPAWAAYRSASPYSRTLFDRTLKKLRVVEVRLVGAKSVGNSDCLVYPAGHCDARIFFFVTDRGEIRVCELALKSDLSYSRLLERGVRREHYPDQEFREWH